MSDIVDRLIQPVIIDMENVFEGYKQTLKDQLNKLPSVLRRKVPSLRQKENRSSSYSGARTAANSRKRLPALDLRR